jgi:Helix-turn-helix domain
MEATVRKTFKYKLMPTPNQIQALELVLWRCRLLYNTALEERKTAWERSGVSVNYYQQKAELPDLKAACPEYAEVNAQVLQDVILRVEHTYQAFFRRAQAGEKAGYPRFKGASRYHSFTYPNMGAVSSWTVACSASRRVGVSPFGFIGYSRALPKPLPSAGRRTAGTPASPALRRLLSRCPQRGERPA